MGNANRQQTIILWIIGILGVLVAIGLVLLLGWVIFFQPAPLAFPTPTVSAVPLTPTAVAQIDTPSMPMPSPTAAHTIVPTQTATPTSPAPTSTLQPPTRTATSTQLPSPAATSVESVDTPSSTPTTPPIASVTPSPYGMITAGTANIRQGPGLEYPVFSQIPYGQYVLPVGRDSTGSWIYVQLPTSELGWVSSSLLSYSQHASLPVIPAPPLPTPTQSPPPSTSTPTPAPTYTPTRTPATPTITPPPTSTFTPAPCSTPVGDVFVETWSSAVRNALGCPTETVKETWTAVQHYERGFMYWREDQRTIYIFTTNNVWRKSQDTWTEGMPEYSCPDTPPSPLVKPKRGFGLIWCTDPQLKSLLGWAIEEERGTTAQFQAFQGGEMLRYVDETVLVLYQNGFWQSYP